MIERNQELIEKLNKTQEDNVKSKRKEQIYSKDFIFVFNKKEIPDESTVESFQTAKNNPILVLIRPTYRIHFKFNNGTNIRDNFTHGTKISEISTFLFSKYKQRYKIIAKSITLKDDYLIEHYIDQQPLLLRIAPPLYYFIINGEEKTLELSESVTEVEAKLSIMFNLLPNITSHHLFYLKYKDKIFNDFDILPSFKKIEVDLTPLNSTFIIILPDMSQISFRLTKKAQNEEDKITEISDLSKIIEISESLSFNHLKKKIQDKCQIKDFTFLFNGKEIPDDSTVKSFQSTQKNPIIISIKQKHQDLLFSENTTKSKNPFIDDEESKFYKTVNIIGESATSTVYKIIDTRTGEILCKKVLKIADEKSQFTNDKNAIKEFEVLYSIKHPCICKAIKINLAEPIDDEKTTISLYFEFLSHSLKECIEKDILDNTLKVRIVIEIVHAMKFIHKHGMIHRDLKVENILLNSIFESKIVDFGLVGIDEYLSGQSFVHSTKTKGIGTLPYMSPEMINEENYDSKTDVYSFGIVLHYLFLKKLPSYNLKDKINGNPIPLPKPSSSITQFGIDLISNCTNYKPSERPSFDVILNDIKKNSFLIAPEIDESLILRRDIELSFFESIIP